MDNSDLIVTYAGVQTLWESVNAIFKGGNEDLLVKGKRKHWRPEWEEMRV